MRKGSIYQEDLTILSAYTPLPRQDVNSPQSDHYMFNTILIQILVGFPLAKIDRLSLQFISAGQ